MGLKWTDRYHRKHEIKDLDDGYLLNILSFIERGKGYVEEMSEDLIGALFAEADKRNLKHRCSKKRAIQLYQKKHYMMAEYAGDEYLYY